VKRALVTGAAGFLGSHLCDALLSRGWSVTGLDNLSTGRMDNLHSCLQAKHFTYLPGDVCVELRTTPVDAVFHMASPASPLDYAAHPIDTLRAGSCGTEHCLDLAARHGAVMLLASTSEVYGDPAVHPQREDYWGNVNPIGPRSVYDEAKRFAEAITMAYHRTHGVDTRIVRIFNTYGPRMRVDDGRVVPTFISQALSGRPLTIFGDGSQTRSLCYVDDTVRGLIALADSAVHEPVNIGNPEERTVSQLAEMICDLVGTKGPVTYCPLPQDDPLRRCPNIDRARTHLGWRPQVGLEEGLRRTIEYHKG
jgi:dTDP-glucose 4,6-dehydratase